MRPRARAALGLGVLLGCGSRDIPSASPNDEKAVAPQADAATAAVEAGEPYAWQPFTRSPQSAEPARDALERACAARDGALERVCAFAARRELAGKAPLDAEDVSLVMRAEGAPYVWPRIWSLSGVGASRQAGARFAAWLATLPSSTEQRCGAAVATDRTGRDVVVGIALEVLADLEPLPTHVSVGAWLSVNARLLVPASGVSVLVLGPRGQPHSVPSSLDRGEVRARFHADREGSYLVQVLANVEGGPRPVAEAVVTAGAVPSAVLTSSPAPGEEAAHAALPSDALFEMINGARSSEGLSVLKRDTRLDRVARAHAEAMRQSGHLAHDAGDGSPSDRVLAAGVTARTVGENVAHAADAQHVHRTLWRSPSHRANLLEPSFDAIGVAVVEDSEQTSWACEVFATLGHP